MRGGSDTVQLVRRLRANVIRARVDGRIRGRIYVPQSDPKSRSKDAACKVGGVHICITTMTYWTGRSRLGSLRLSGK